MILYLRILNGWYNSCLIVEKDLSYILVVLCGKILSHILVVFDDGENFGYAFFSHAHRTYLGTLYIMVILHLKLLNVSYYPRLLVMVRIKFEYILVICNGKTPFWCFWFYHIVHAIRGVNFLWVFVVQLNSKSKNVRPYSPVSHSEHELRQDNFVWNFVHANSPMNFLLFVHRSSVVRARTKGVRTELLSGSCSFETLIGQYTNTHMSSPVRSARLKPLYAISKVWGYFCMWI